MSEIIPSPAIIVRKLGVVPYEPVWDDMKSFTLGRTDNTPDEFWALQHEPVFTLGQAGKSEHILDPHTIPVIKIDRGGQVTYHAPGQLIVYTLIDVKRKKLGVRHLVDGIEQSIISVLDDMGIAANTKKRAPGVYVGEKKIAALGLRIKNGCSYHGLSLNIDMDLEPFLWINPCGYKGMETTQLTDLLEPGNDNLFSSVEQKLLNALQNNLL